MKKIELFFSALKVPVDYLMVLLAGTIAYFLRVTQSVQESHPILYKLGLSQYFEMILVMGGFFVIIFAVEGLYQIRANEKMRREIYRVFRSTIIGLMIIIIGVFINRDWFSSRFIILSGGVLVFVFVSGGRIILNYLQRYFLVSRGMGVHRLLLIGVNGFCTIVNREIKKDKKLGYKIVGHLEDIDFDRIDRIKKMKGVDEIIECSSGISKTNLFKLKEYCVRNKILFKYVPTLLQTANFNVNIFLGEPIIEVKNTPLDGWGKIIKRIFDIIGAIIGIIIFGPVMLLTALAIWLESGRPIIFKNERVGHKGDFDLYKFRYMKNKYCHGKQYSSYHNKKALAFLEKLIKKQSIKKGPLYKIKNDPRKTKIGIFLEKYSIDELPQFFNILRGEMSLVGPRPHQPIEVKKYQDYAKRVLTIKPGATGMAQVSGRSDLSFEDEVRLDIFYIENWSLWGDIKIILKTIPVILKRRGN